MNTSKKRLRDLGPVIGRLPVGPLNAITDVPGVWVGQVTLIADEPRVVRTGVTLILPREHRIWKEPVFAAHHSLNGYGEMTGIHWVTESGMLATPVALTNTGQVGIVYETLGLYAMGKGYTPAFEMPVVGETCDSGLCDISISHVTPSHVLQALESAGPGPVAEGCVGGGTGMTCHDFKSGIGTSSRVVKVPAGTFTLGVLVQANYGSRRDLRLDGIPVGLEIPYGCVPSGWDDESDLPRSPGDGSIAIVIATDAPFLPSQCKRLAQRATAGLARTGGFGNNGSGDLFLAFSTANLFDPHSKQPIPLTMLSNDQMDPFFLAVAEAVEEAIWNALIAAETMTGHRAITFHAIPHEEVQRVWKKYRSS